jgi:hypothetical protein
MPQIHAVRAARSLNGTVVDRKADRVTLAERNYFRP